MKKNLLLPTISGAILITALTVETVGQPEIDAPGLPKRAIPLLNHSSNSNSDKKYRLKVFKLKTNNYLTQNSCRILGRRYRLNRQVMTSPYNWRHKSRQRNSMFVEKSGALRRAKVPQTATKEEHGKRGINRLYEFEGKPSTIYDSKYGHILWNSERNRPRSKKQKKRAREREKRTELAMRGIDKIKKRRHILTRAEKLRMAKEGERWLTALRKLDKQRNMLRLPQKPEKKLPAHMELCSQ